MSNEKEKETRIPVDMSGLSADELRELGKGVQDELKKRTFSRTPEPNAAIRAMLERGLFYSAVDMYRRQYCHVTKAEAERVLQKYKK